MNNININGEDGVNKETILNHSFSNQKTLNKNTYLNNWLAFDKCTLRMYVVVT